MFKKVKFLHILVLNFLFILKGTAQIPKEVPHPNNNSPVDFSKTEDIIIYIVLPVIFIVLYFISRKYRHKKKENSN
ncbi:hypothetical protein BXY75_1304 [Ulvibacter antarcticus]|uniref:Adenylosuccinate synthetase n=1 Tax=Ulvibacter antarcticus TaxID=442714 RepID=A0A3L9YZA5_9FLAO|nr:hypothetical protein BXY75_1304 [Ulvibacter antarcticus]